MAISLSDIKKGAQDRAPMTLIYSPPGKGKTTFAASAPDPIFIRVEDGLGNLEVDTFPLSDSYDDVLAALISLYEDGHGYEHVVIDGLSALEPLIWDKVAADNDVANIEKIGYAKGYIFAMTYWRELVSAFYGLAKRGVAPIMIAHADIVKFDSPDADPYDRYQIKLHRRAFAHLYEQCDVIGFAHDPVYVAKQDTKDTKGKAKPKGQRLLVLEESPAMIAKNRYQMPESVPFDFESYAQHIPYYNRNS